MPFKKFSDLIAGNTEVKHSQTVEAKLINEEQSVIQKLIERQLTDSVMLQTVIAQIAALGFKITFQRINATQKIR